LIVGIAQPDGTFRGSISDGFTGGSLGTLPSFSYGLSAGEDNLLQPGPPVPTPTGSTPPPPGPDLPLSPPAPPTPTPPRAAPPPDARAVVYPAGRRSPTPGFAPPASAGEFPVDGGDIDLRAGRDILAPYALQSTSAWLFRFGDTSWGGDVDHSTVLQQASWS